MTLNIEPLTFYTPQDVRASLDKLLTSEQRQLALESEHVDGIEDRLVDAQGKERRLLFWAAMEGKPVGMADIVLHSPEAGTATIAAIAVVKDARHKGVARSLVKHAISIIAENGTVDVVAAGVHRDNQDALAFFAKLGLELGLGDDPNDPVLIVSAELSALV
jgi:ribosomal protein S18 acetylase RimI-like enzyme